MLPQEKVLERVRRGRQLQTPRLPTRRFEVATQNGGMAFRSQHPILLAARGGVCVVCGHGGVPRVGAFSLCPLRLNPRYPTARRALLLGTTPSQSLAKSWPVRDLLVNTKNQLPFLVKRVTVHILSPKEGWLRGKVVAQLRGGLIMPAISRSPKDTRHGGPQGC